MHCRLLFFAELDFFYKLQGCCDIATSRQHYVFHCRIVAAVQEARPQDRGITLAADAGSGCLHLTKLFIHRILLAASFKKPTNASSSITGLSGRPVLPTRCPYAPLPACRARVYETDDNICRSKTNHGHEDETTCGQPSRFHNHHDQRGQIAIADELNCAYLDFLNPRIVEGQRRVVKRGRHLTQHFPGNSTRSCISRSHKRWHFRPYESYVLKKKPVTILETSTGQRAHHRVTRAAGYAQSEG
jgi:hypothetical protein